MSPRGVGLSTTHPIESRCLGCYGRKPFELYHVTMIFVQNSSGLAQETMMPRGNGLFAAHLQSLCLQDKVRRDLIDLMYEHTSNRGLAIVRDLLPASSGRCHKLNRHKSSDRHATPRPTPRSTPQMSSLSSPRIAGKLFSGCANLLWFYGYSSIRMPEVLRNAMHRFWLTCITRNAICCVLHGKHRSRHAGYPVSHLAWPSVRTVQIRTC